MRQLSGADGHHVSVETPTQPQHTLKCMILDPAGAHEPITFERVRTWAAAVLPHVPPLRWQLAPPPLGLGHPFWVDRPDLDVDVGISRRFHKKAGGRYLELEDDHGFSGDMPRLIDEAVRFISQKRGP